MRVIQIKSKDLVDSSLERIFVGTGGWSYLNKKGGDKLRAYSKLFNFVEVNSTFYRIPPLSLVETWRKRVYTNFTFTVRCHREVTHKYGLRDCEETVKLFDKMLKICRILRAPILHLQTPPSQRFNKEECQYARDLLSTLVLNDTRLAWEPRGGFTPPLMNLMKDLNVIPTVDISRDQTPFDSDILYTRLFGKGFHTIYEFDDDELRQIEKYILEKAYKKAFLVFHSLRMYEDAHRLVVHMKSGVFPPSRRIGLEALKEIFLNIRYPITKDELIRKEGWKIINISGKNVHVSTILNKLREDTYVNPEDLINEVSTFFTAG